MKILTIIIMITLCISCGKRSEEEDNTVSTIPAIIGEDDTNNDNTHQNSHFSVTANQSVFNMNDLIMLEVQNLSTDVLDHFKFNFSADTEELLLSRINCFKDLAYLDRCSFIVRFKNPKAGYHRIKVGYEGLQISMTVQLQGDDTPNPIEFLYKDHHTFNDCYKAFKYNKNGFVKYSGGENYCSFRGQHWDTDMKVELEENPLQAMVDSNIDADSYYCPAGWTVSSFEFAETVVVEHTNFFGGRKDVTIPAGGHKEICIKRNLFGCKERKVFYSRLVKVNCY